MKAAYLKAREIDARVSGLKEAVAAGRETARLAPPLRRSQRHLELYAAAADQIDLTVRDDVRPLPHRPQRGAARRRLTGTALGGFS